MRQFFTIGFFTFLTHLCVAQIVTVAEEINIRNDYAYDILGQINENILLYRDKGKDQMINIYDRDLRFKRERELKFEKNRVRIININPVDTAFDVIYQYRLKDTTYLKMRRFDENVIVKDTFTLETRTDNKVPRFMRYTISEDHSKTAIFGINKDDFLELRVIDHRKDRLLWGTQVELGDIDFNDHFQRIVVSNEGMVMILFEENNHRFKKDDHHLTLLGLLEGQLIKKSAINFSERLSTGIHLAFNNYNGNVLITGLSHERKDDAATDYFFLNKHITEYQEKEKPVFVSFGLEFIAELYGKKIGKEKELKDFMVKDIILRQDGGFVLLTEMDKSFSRRSAFANPTISSRSRNSLNAGRGWTDHYNEDVAIIAVRPDGYEHWKTILYKKQFSQDDGGVFSSYFVFKTPSRLKLIYNDEIKNNNTASEYILDPLGKYERNSLLSTDYQNLRLRFRDAVQISNSSLLVPSEKSYNLRLVKIDYSG